MISRTNQMKYPRGKSSGRFLAGLALAALLFTGCREVYNPDDLVSGERIPVIQGRIPENGAPVVVLTWAMAYDDKMEEGISNARVSLADNEGNTVQLAETDAGVYTVQGESFPGIAGRSYTLEVELEDGSVFESNLIPMHGWLPSGCIPLLPMCTSITIPSPTSLVRMTRCLRPILHR